MADKIWLDIIYVDMIRLQSNESLNQLVQRIIFYFLSLLVVTQIRGHTAGSSSPPIHYGSCLAFLSREDFSSFFPRRLASNCAYPS